MQTIVRACVVLCLLGCHVRWLRSEKVLLIPSPMYSVCRSLVAIGQQLVLKGHEVVVYQVDKFAPVCPGPNGMRTIEYRTATASDYKTGMAKWQALMKRVIMANPWEKTYLSINHLSQSLQRGCTYTLGDPSITRKLREENFDFVVIDGAIQNVCFAVIPHMLKVPFAAFGGIVFPWSASQPFRPHVSPSYLTPCTSDMTIVEMILNAVSVAYNYLYCMYNIPMDFVARVAPELTRKQTIDLLFSASLYLLNDVEFLGYPFGPSTNVVPIGGVLATPGKPIPADIKHFLDEASSGAIVVAFGGSSFTAMPSYLQDLFTQVFANQNVSTLWKSGVDQREGNVMMRTWLPLNDVLSHSNIRLLIYHCGRGGFFEAVYHGVPLICLPIMYDQDHFAARVEKLGVGKKLQLRSLSSDSFRRTIEEVLRNETYKLNSMKLSKLFHQHPQNATERAAYWIDHVMKEGDGHLRPSTGLFQGHLELICLGFGTCLLTTLVCVFCCRLIGKKTKTNPRSKID